MVFFVGLQSDWQSSIYYDGTNENSNKKVKHTISKKPQLASKYKT